MSLVPRQLQLNCIPLFLPSRCCVTDYCPQPRIYKHILREPPAHVGIAVLQNGWLRPSYPLSSLGFQTKLVFILPLHPLCNVHVRDISQKLENPALTFSQNIFTMRLCDRRRSGGGKLGEIHHFTSEFLLYKPANHPRQGTLTRGNIMVILSYITLELANTMC